MKIYNSLTKKMEEFKIQDRNESGDSKSETINARLKTVVMYVCGLTPYDSTHIGHARTYVAFDIIKRYLLKKGYNVYHIQNITDVDDKIIKRCKETAADPKKLTKTNHDEALELFDVLNIIHADVYPKVTEHIPEIIVAIEKLIIKGAAYETKTGVYYSVSKFKDYGALSGQKQNEIKAGARVEVDESKHAPEDFAVWKKTNGELIEFDSPWGKGRPGWHIECSAMAEKYAKGPLDIHGGARDLIFPHHENEIAQSESAFNHKFCNYWLHTGFLTVSGEKMSKSLGNFITLKEALSRFDPNAVRMFFVQTHYRSPIDYDEDTINASSGSVERLFNSLGLIEESLSKKDKKDETFQKESNESILSFYKSMEKDFDTPNALAAIFNLVTISNTHVSKETVDRTQLEKIREEMKNMLWIFGLEEKKKGVTSKLGQLLLLAEDIKTNYGISIKESDKADEVLEGITGAREELRKRKNYAASDKIRDTLGSMGISLEDSSKGIKKKIR